MAARLKTGDEVLVISGSAKGHRGKILRLERKGTRAFVDGVNMVKRHRKAQAPGQLTGIIEQPGSVDLSNLKLIDQNAKLPAKVGFRFHDGKKLRVNRRSGEVIE